MTVTDQIKISRRKIKQNEAQYDFDRKAAKTSALSSNNLDKCEYMTGEDLGLKPSTVEKAKFEYSPLGMSLNKTFKKMKLKVSLKAKVILIMIAIMFFLNFTKGIMILMRCH